MSTNAPALPTNIRTGTVDRREDASHEGSALHGWASCLLEDPATVGWRRVRSAHPHLLTLSEDQARQVGPPGHSSRFRGTTTIGVDSRLIGPVFRPDRAGLAGQSMQPGPS